MPFVKSMAAFIALWLLPGAVNAEGGARQSQYIEMICVANIQSYEELLVFADDMNLALPAPMADQLQSASQTDFEAWMSGFCGEEGWIEVRIEDKPGALVGHTPADADDAAWGAAKRADTEEAYQRYLEQFPEGRHAGEALTNKLKQALGGSISIGVQLAAEEGQAETAKEEPEDLDLQTEEVFSPSTMQTGSAPPEELTFTDEEKIMLDQLTNLEFEQPTFQCLGDYYRCRFIGINWLACFSVTAACMAERIIPMAGK